MIDSKAANCLAHGRTSVDSWGQQCELICSRSGISKSFPAWLSVWRCCRRRAKPSRKRTNDGFAPAMFFGSVHRKFLTWDGSRPACADNGLV